MDEARLLGAVLRGVMGGRRKRGRKAMSHLLGSSSGLWSNPQVLLTAAGLAWGLIESATNQAGSGTAPAAGRATGGPSGAPPSTGAPVPPLPAVAAAGGAAGLSDAQRMIRLAVSASHADGAMGPAEATAVRRIVAEHGAGDAGVDIERPSPLAEIVAGVTDVGHRATLYALAFAVVRADERVSGAERIYLAQLAHLLGLDADAVSGIERTTVDRIDGVREAASTDGRA